MRKYKILYIGKEWSENSRKETESEINEWAERGYSIVKIENGYAFIEKIFTPKPTEECTCGLEVCKNYQSGFENFTRGKIVEFTPPREKVELPEEMETSFTFYGN